MSGGADVARNLQVRFEPMAIWGEENGRRVVTGQHETLVQMSVATPQTRRAQQYPIENVAERDMLVSVLEKAIVSLKALKNLPAAPVATERSASHTSVAALPANVITAESLMEILAAERRNNEKLMQDSMNALLAAVTGTAAPSPKPAAVSGNGERALAKL